MSATTDRHPAAVVAPLVTMPGSILLDLGDFMPTVANSQQRALDVLDARAATRTTRILPSGEVPTPGLATCTATQVREAVTTPTVPAGDCFHNP